MEMRRGRRSYRSITVTLRDKDLAETDRIAGALKDEGWEYSNRSFVVRAALVCLSDTLRGKEPGEILQFLADRRARRPPRNGPPSHTV